MGNDFDATRVRRRILGALAVLASLVLGSAPAQAQICGDPEDIAEDLFGLYSDQFEDFFPLSATTCESMGNAMFKACTTAVKDAVKCAERQIDGIPKAAKPACKEASKNPSACNDSFEADADDAKESVEEDADLGISLCANAAFTFFSDCQST